MNWKKISTSEPKDHVETLGRLASIAALALGGSFAIVRFGQIETQIHAEHLDISPSFCKARNTLRTGIAFGIRNTGHVAFPIKWSCIQVFTPPLLPFDENDNPNNNHIKTMEDYIIKSPTAPLIKCRDSTELVEPGEDASAVFTIFTPTADGTKTKLKPTITPEQHTEPLPGHDSPFALWTQEPDQTKTEETEPSLLIVRSFIFSETAAKRICKNSIATAGKMENCLRNKGAQGERLAVIGNNGKGELKDHDVGIWSTIVSIWVPEVARSCGELFGRCYISEGEPGRYSILEDLTESVCDELAGATPHLFFLTTSKIR